MLRCSRRSRQWDKVRALLYSGREQTHPPGHRNYNTHYVCAREHLEARDLYSRFTKENPTHGLLLRWNCHSLTLWPAEMVMSMVQPNTLEINNTIKHTYKNVMFPTLGNIFTQIEPSWPYFCPSTTPLPHACHALRGRSTKPRSAPRSRASPSAAGTYWSKSGNGGSQPHTPHSGPRGSWACRCSGPSPADSPPRGRGDSCRLREIPRSPSFTAPLKANMS